MHQRALSLGLLLFVLGFCARVKGAVFTVTSTTDSGPGSLRQAILDANANAGPDIINFAIGSGVQTITPSTALPIITDPVTMDGTTQPGFTTTPIIELYGNLTRTFDGLTLNTTNCTVRSLVIRGFGDTGSARRSGIVLTNFGGHTIVGCYLGTTAAGTAASRNSQAGLQIIDSANNRIGGTNANEGNLISGNSRTGIEIFGGGATNNIVIATIVGLNAPGTAALANSSGGILISNAPNNIVGGVVAAARNFIAGNSSENIRVTLPGATGNQILGNWIGLRTDSQPLTTTYSSANGIRIDNAPSNTVGGASAAARNVIGNVSAGVQLTGSNATANVIQGNYLGTATNGMLILSNFNGVSISARANGNLIGGTNPGAGNVISGNRNYGITINDSSSTIVQGNLIGTDALGAGAIPNGIPGSGAGINIGTASQSATNNLIGGPTVAARNLISGNRNDGLVITGTGASNNVVQGNYLGVAADGVTPLSNAKRGIVTLGAHSNLFGGNIVGTGNVIAYNGLDGIWLAATFGAFGTPGTNNLVQGNLIYSNGVSVLTNGGYAAGITLLGANRISRNSIYGNIYSGIDRGGDGPTANTPGNRHNYPIITATRRGSTEAICTWDAEPFETCTAELYANSTCHPVGGCQAQTFLCSQEVMADANGHAEFTFTCPNDTADGSMITVCGTAFDGESFEIGPGLVFPTIFPVVVNVPASDANTITAGEVGHPVSTFTGELFEGLPPDLSLAGPMPLVFARYYAAFLKKDGLASGKLGDNWLHNFEMTLTVTSSNTVNVVNHLGRLISFTNTAGNFALIGRQDLAFQLATNSGNYVLGDPRSQRLFTFDSTGKLLQISDGHGNAHTLTYAGNLLTNVSDGLGRVFTFQYNGSGQLTNVTDGSRSVAFAQTGNNLISARSPLGFITTYTYDLANTNNGLMTAATKPAGNQPFTQTFDAQGRVATQTEAGSNVWSLNFASLTTTVTNPAGNAVQDVHTATGELASYKDEAGQTLPLGSNAKGQRSLVTDRLGNSTGIAYHAPSGKPAALTNADGTVTLMSYAPRTNGGVVFYDLNQVSYPDGAAESFSYDNNGNLKTRIDRAGQLWGFGYNARGQVLTATNPLGGVVTFTYGADGMLASQKDSDTGLSQFQYDSLKRLTNVINPDGTTVRAAYDADNRLVSVTDERGGLTQLTYDVNNRLANITDALGQSVQFAYDQANRLVRAIDRLGQAAGTAYDQFSHVATVTNRNGNVTRYAYDARQRLAAVTDPGNQVWSFDYDAEGRLSAAANPLNQTNRLGRDQLGYPTAATNALGQSARVVRDGLRRVTQAMDGISRTNGFAYDARGLLTNASAPLIGAAVYERNPLGQLSRITGLNGEQWNFSYTPMGRLQSSRDPLNRVTTLTHDQNGRSQKTTFPDGVTCSNSFDAAGNITRLKYSSGPDLSYTYDALNRLVTADNLAFAYDAEGRVTNTLSSGVNYGASYDAGGRLTRVTYHNAALTVNYAYDSRDRLTNVTDTLTGTQIGFTYDNAGRLTGITRPSSVNSVYTYDAAGRLTRIQEGAVVDIQYTLDAADQITAANFTAPLDPADSLAPANPTFGYDAAHQIKNAGYGFDARGRLTVAPGHAFSWDGASRLTAIDSVVLSYNGADNILTRTASGVITRFYYNHAVEMNPIMAERNETANATQRYYVWTPEGRLLYIINAASGNTVSYVHTDRVGSVLALTSAAGAVTDAYAYSPYGVLLARTGANPQPFTYIGAFGVRYEPAANLYQMRARYYDPNSARFLSRDPVWPRLGNPRGLDPYAYVAGNPLSYLDPSGEITLLGVIKGVVNEGTELVGDVVSVGLEAGSAGVRAVNSGMKDVLDVVHSAARELSPYSSTARELDLGIRAIKGDALVLRKIVRRAKGDRKAHDDSDLTGPPGQRIKRRLVGLFLRSIRTTAPPPPAPQGIHDAEPFFEPADVTPWEEPQDVTPWTEPQDVELVGLRAVGESLPCEYLKPFISCPGLLPLPGSGDTSDNREFIGQGLNLGGDLTSGGFTTWWR